MLLPCGRELGALLCEEGLARWREEDRCLTTNEQTVSQPHDTEIPCANDVCNAGETQLDVESCINPSAAPDGENPKISQRRLVN